MRHDDRPHDVADSGGEAHAESTFAALAAPLVDEALSQSASIHADASPESLHQLRVALRRLRSLWWAYGPLLDRQENARQRALYRFLADAAGKTRDWDILLELLASKTNETSEPGEEGALRAAPACLREARERALAASRETLINADIRNVLHGALASTSKELNSAPERHALQKFAAKRVRAAEKSLRKRMDKASRAKPADYDALHDVRKAGKKVRYLIELFGPVLDDVGHDHTLKRLKKLQQCFGELNDVTASIALLRENTGLFADEAEARAALALLKERRKARRREAVQLLRET
ncbi:CHAD domain-containing protein [Paraburkholderia caribensis]|jgi:CHAD domain-containing protein|uniref:CHAD domain-containing protein n=1 Tax=Paraburkholderia caribensis TaxID=75105 RepID=A0A9Q6S2L8_9BURK|nr:CHAD domain-containing protein [Paraburkholderia caribensis]ALP62670.1 metal-binding protein [Paraburkholderia caribensis]AUT52100.1 CHAD domain-containing protein [Paraburkholderia caribensis]MCO4881105.1 CHAD domain-containing protein [Paraburkholderia caribensis]PTB27360.1 CHAD domain-containing protein [Paraburkholderia caribensis]QLB63687.1 metal-binding protein [Paraburkholderia caribensis]